MRVAALDLGTNSFLCLIAEVEDGKVVRILSDQMQIVRLGQGVDESHRFHPEALQRARKCLSEFKIAIDQWQPEKILAMATSAARDVANADELFQIGRDLQIPIQIIPGNKEAEITFFGSLSGTVPDKKIRAVIDVGGGSTEIICGTHQNVVESISLNIGGVRLTEKFLPRQPASEKEYEDLKEVIANELSAITPRLKQQNISELMAVAGTPTELARVILGQFDAQKIDGLRLSRVELERWLQQIKNISPAERVQKYGFAKGRADIILAGILILLTTLEQLDLDELSVSTRGVRFGIALELARAELAR
jgi:exopolyphosphatase/guanosine-5'-triphosphate,3'-diphosphate pyrophosphatase